MGESWSLLKLFFFFTSAQITKLYDGYYSILLRKAEKMLHNMAAQKQNDNEVW